MLKDPTEIKKKNYINKQDWNADLNLSIHLRSTGRFIHQNTSFNKVLPYSVLPPHLLSCLSLLPLTLFKMFLSIQYSFFYHVSHSPHHIISPYELPQVQEPANNVKSNHAAHDFECVVNKASKEANVNPKTKRKYNKGNCVEFNNLFRNINWNTEFQNLSRPVLLEFLLHLQRGSNRSKKERKRQQSIMHDRKGVVKGPRKVRIHYKYIQMAQQSGSTWKVQKDMEWK